MIRHIVMWKFRPGTQAEQAQFLDGLRGLQGVEVLGRGIQAYQQRG